MSVSKGAMIYMGEMSATACVCIVFLFVHAEKCMWPWKLRTRTLPLACYGAMEQGSLYKTLLWEPPRHSLNKEKPQYAYQNNAFFSARPFIHTRLCPKTALKVFLWTVDMLLPCRFPRKFCLHSKTFFSFKGHWTGLLNPFKLINDLLSTVLSLFLW